jgi:hypothetical protein
MPGNQIFSGNFSETLTTFMGEIESMLVKGEYSDGTKNYIMVIRKNILLCASRGCRAVLLSVFPKPTGSLSICILTDSAQVLYIYHLWNMDPE